jgi:hypothetical protein
VNKIHWAYQDDGRNTLIYIYRDPRDCALSGWEYIKHHFAPDVTLMNFLRIHFSGHWSLWPCGWREHTRRWMNREAIPKVCYETLCTDREAILRLLVCELYGTMDEDHIAHAVAQSYNFGQRNDGRWVSELPKEAVVWIDNYCGDLMEELGYTQKGEK